MPGSAVKVMTFTAQGAGTTTTDVTIDEQSYGTSGQWIAIVVEVTAVGGTPTLDVTVTWSGSGTTFVAADGTADAFAQITTAAGKAKQFAVKGKVARISAVIAGTTPTITGSVWVLPV